jgi:uncharacterized coiled-coil DUF342 family protein
MSKLLSEERLNRLFEALQVDGWVQPAMELRAHISAQAEQIQSLTKERDAARSDATHLNECWINRWKPERDRLIERVKKLRKTLVYYAEPLGRSYEDHDEDGFAGRRAKEALAKDDELAIQT